MATFGFIGCGNMGGALIRAVCRAVPADEVFVTNRTAEKAAALAAETGCSIAIDNDAVAGSADFIVLGVKPQMMEDVLTGIAPVLAKRETPFVLVTMAAGLTIDAIRQMADGDYPVIRIMPNTPVSTGEGVVLCAVSDNVKTAAENAFLSALDKAGRIVSLPEKLIDAGSAVAGCGPAFVDLFIEALADGGVACGLPRAQALELAAQMVLGSARLVLESGRHPGDLKDAVCSPGGTTIQGVRALEEGGFRGTVMDAVIAAYERTLELKQ